LGNWETGARAGLYIHVPFCSSICPYCDFSVLIAGEERRAAWAAGVVREAEISAADGLIFDTVYFGGGTPSAMTPAVLSDVIGGVRGHLEISPEAWLALEANPEDVTQETATAWKGFGVRTVSLGVQSFDDRALAFLGRKHSAADACSAVEILRGTGFDEISVDLIYGLPEQTLASWQSQIEQTVAFGVEHVSCYQLTFHQRTVFGRRWSEGRIRELSEDEQGEFFMLTHELLTAAGYEGYEVSNFAAAPEYRSRHNQKYWDHSPYIGLGPSAHSFVSGRRWWNHRKLRLWQKALDEGGLPVEGDERLTKQQLLLEAVMLGLRTADGLDLEYLHRRFDLDLLPSNATTVENLCQAGHLTVVGHRLVPTTRGLAISDTLARAFDLTIPQK
jgi:oxygen-independent coproporphyrinogen-3 oxidase